MGDVAGSGGYYVACAVRHDLRRPATITGSIGVVSGKFVTNPMWDKVGITFKSYKRGEQRRHARQRPRRSRRKSANGCRARWTRSTASSRATSTAIRGDRLKKPIDELAGGRVYTGKQALELGLVDKIGTMQDADPLRRRAGEADRVRRPRRAGAEEHLRADHGSDRRRQGRQATWTAAPPRLRVTGPSLVDLAAPHLQRLDPQRVRLIRTRAPVADAAPRRRLPHHAGDAGAVMGA